MAVNIADFMSQAEPGAYDKLRIAVVGATGNVGREMLEVLYERGFGSANVTAVASRRSQEQALTDFATLQARYPGILGAYRPFIERADLGSRGIYYRLRVGPLGSQASAGQLCDQLKAAGLPDCLVRRN